MLICRRPPVVQKNRRVDDKPMRWKILYWWGLLATIVFKDEINRLVQQLMNVLFMRAFGVWIVPMRNWNTARPFRFAAPRRVWIVPMRNWNNRWNSVRRHSSNIVWIVPMRNWNKRTSRLITSPLWRLDRTYEELKLASYWARRYQAALFGSYLWGIETRKINHCKYDRVSFGSYLWGIETFNIGGGLVCSRICLDRTYEELKLRLVCPRAWQYFPVWIVPMRNWNLTGTASVPPLDKKVWIVPMRNWNIT